MLTADTPYVARKPMPVPRGWGRGGLLDQLVGPQPDDQATRQALDVTVADIDRLQQVSGLPVVVKGVLRADDARVAVEAGAAGVIVSNHGGRQLDGAVPTAWALAEVVAAVRGGAEVVPVLVDGGIRTGRDALKALTLGADAVMLGRAVLWALAIDGAAGVRDLLDGISSDLTEAMGLAGCESLRTIGPDLLWRAGP